MLSFMLIVIANWLLNFILLTFYLYVNEIYALNINNVITSDDRVIPVHCQDGHWYGGQVYVSRKTRPVRKGTASDVD